MEQIERYPIIKMIMKVNPIYYIVAGYRDCFFYHEGMLHYWKQGLLFWAVTFVLFAIGSIMMHKFKHKFIDMI